MLLFLLLKSVKSIEFLLLKNEKSFLITVDDFLTSNKIKLFLSIGFISIDLLFMLLSLFSLSTLDSFNILFFLV